MQITDQRFALEMTLGKLGLSAKSDFLRVKDVFAQADKDDSGFIDGDELVGAKRPHQ